MMRRNLSILKRRRSVTWNKINPGRTNNKTNPATTKAKNKAKRTSKQKCSLPRTVKLETAAGIWISGLKYHSVTLRPLEEHTKHRFSSLKESKGVPCVRTKSVSSNRRKRQQNQPYD